MPRPKDGMTKRKLLAAEMLGRGMRDHQVEAELGISRTTLWRWKSEDIFIDSVILASNKALMGAVPLARQLLQDQMDDDNRWLAQNAANSLLRERGVVSGDTRQQVIVSFGQADLDIGMPEDITLEPGEDA